MAYVSLYRRFRPDTFDKLYGQEHIVRTLKRQVANGEIGHAYLFTGTRGVGKTSAARIFARAINCINPIDGSPCGECSACRALSQENNMDMLEIDAASNNGVEEIRDLREKIKYRPVTCRYKVYIIDEVHMLSAAAFNALLKTLEEPPSHAVFILATTEAHKLPATILSRCMRFDFRLISTEEIAKHLAAIFAELGREYEEEALTVIASAGNGSVRDALSVADLCLSYSKGKLKYEEVLEVLGATDRATVMGLARNILQNDVNGLLTLIDKTVRAGCNVTVLARDLSSLIRNIMIVKNCNFQLDIPKEQQDEMRAIGDSVDNWRLLRVLEILSNLEGALRNSAQTRLLLETACVKAAELKSDLTAEGLIGRINAIESRLEQGVAVASVAAVAGVGAVKPEARKVWGQVITKLSGDKMYALSSACSGVTVAYENNKFVVTAKTPLDYNTITREKNFEYVTATLKSFTDAELDVRKGFTENAGNIDGLKTLVDSDILQIKKI